MPARVSFAVSPLAVAWTLLARYPGQVEFESVEFWRGYSGEDGLARAEAGARASVTQKARKRRDMPVTIPGVVAWKMCCEMSRVTKKDEWHEKPF